MDSYGYVETRGLVTAIEAADAALKAADVTLMNCYYVKGGIVRSDRGCGCCKCRCGCRK